MEALLTIARRTARRTKLSGTQFLKLAMEYKTQVEAFANAKENDFVFAYEVSKFKRVFIACTNEDYWNNFLHKNRLYGYEIIRENKPCHLHIDLDVDRERFPCVNVDTIWITLENHIDKIFSAEYEIDSCDIQKHIMHSTSIAKGSMHIVYNVKGYLFENNAHVGAFMRGVKELVEMHYPEDITMFDEGFVDMGIYTRNRQFRMLGCAKFNTMRIIKDSNELTLEHWVDCKVQPAHKGEKFFHITEPDRSEPKYTSGGGGITGYVPDCIKPILQLIEAEKDTLVTRVHAFPLSLTFACNLRTKRCPFLNRTHSKNVIYAIINLTTQKYRYRCHSDKCNGHESDAKPFPPDIQQEVLEFLNAEVILPEIA